VIAACLIDWNWVPPRDYIPVGTCYNTLYSETRIAQPTVFRHARMDVTLSQGASRDTGTDVRYELAEIARYIPAKEVSK